jgi:hypothetical protein
MMERTNSSSRPTPLPQGEGLTVSSAFIHDLSASLGQGRIAVPVDQEQQGAARKRLGEAALGIRARRFDPRPGRACETCDVCAVCRRN